MGIEEVGIVVDEPVLAVLGAGVGGIGGHFPVFSEESHTREEAVDHALGGSAFECAALAP